MGTEQPSEQYLTRSEAAALLKLRPATLARWAWEGTGPKTVRIGRRAVRYPLSELQAFIRTAEAA